MVYLLNCVFIFLALISLSQQQILCTKSVCEDYIEKNPCSELSDKCKTQNTTYNGLVLPHPSPCNCCDFCIDNLALDDVCILGSPDGPVPDKICGDGLFCDKTTSKCVANPLPCMRDQEKYKKKKKNGQLGYLELQPQCDRRGMYLQVKCIPGEICFCVDKNGNRIFGEMPYNVQALDITKCGCSRSVENINEVLGGNRFSTLRPKCLSNGNFDSIQCTDESCVCVDEFNGSPTDSAMRPVNIYLASEMSCFNNESHPEGVYLNACERKYIQILKDINKYKNAGFKDVFGYIKPNCQLDGRFAAVQESETEKYCADPDGKQIENFKVAKNDKLSKTMNCYCARAKSIIPWHEKPSCCANGNYKCMQCRRGQCHCVDTNGLQIQKEVPYEKRKTLSCSNCDCTQ